MPSGKRWIPASAGMTDSIVFEGTNVARTVPLGGIRGFSVAIVTTALERGDVQGSRDAAGIKKERQVFTDGRLHFPPVEVVEAFSLAVLNMFGEDPHGVLGIAVR